MGRRRNFVLKPTIVIALRKGRKFNVSKKKKEEVKKDHEKKENHKDKMKKDPKAKHMKKGEAKVEKVMHEYKEGDLHSGSKKGPKVSNPKQAIAIALSEARKAGASIPKKKKKK